MAGRLGSDAAMTDILLAVWSGHRQGRWPDQLATPSREPARMVATEGRADARRADRARSGRPVPGTFAAEEEPLALADALKQAGHGVFEGIVAGTIGKLESLGGEAATPLDELPGTARRVSGFPSSCSSTS